MSGAEAGMLCKMRLSRFLGGVVLLCAAPLVSGASAAVSTSYPGCYLQHPDDFSYLGNGDCDVDYNEERCGFDGGDCCPCTCQEGQEYECGRSGYDCVDPAASCFVDPVMILRDLQSTDPDETTASPSSAPTITPTSFLDANAEDISAAVSKLSTGALAAIIAACIFVVLITVALYLYSKKQSRGASGTTFATAESASLT